MPAVPAMSPYDLTHLIVEGIGVLPLETLSEIASYRPDRPKLTEDELTMFIDRCIDNPLCGHADNNDYRPPAAKQAAALRSTKMLTNSENQSFVEKIMHDGVWWEFGFEIAGSCEDLAMPTIFADAFLAALRRRDAWGRGTHWASCVKYIVSYSFDVAPYRELAEEYIYKALDRSEQYAELYVSGAAELVGLPELGISTALRERVIRHCIEQGAYTYAEKALPARPSRSFTLDELQACLSYWLHRGGYPWHIEALKQKIALQTS